jgi:hypothetical protein
MAAPRVSRVRQLDASALDAILHGLLKSGVNNALGLFKVGLWRLQPKGNVLPCPRMGGLYTLPL